MSDDNRTDGAELYRNGDAATREWFERQWSIWPARADSAKTTNLSFHHGGVHAFREAHGREPTMSRSFRDNVEWLDRRTP